MNAKQAISDGQAAAKSMEAAGQSLKNRVNVYACTPSLAAPIPGIKPSGCGYSIVTIDRDTGVTPMFVTCGNCGAHATSRMYKVAPGNRPTHEWIRPASINDIPRRYRNAGAFDHIANGGLILRPIGKDEWTAPTPEVKAFIEEEHSRLTAMRA